MTLQKRTAAQGVGSLNGGGMEKLGSIFQSDKYTAPCLSTMPSTERAGRMARVVSRGGKLFAVGHFDGGVR